MILLYCVASGAFFAAAAYAQLNDPDPELWVAGYVLGGCVFNAWVVLFSGSGGAAASSLSWLMKIYVVGTAFLLIMWTKSLAVKLDFRQSLSNFFWSFLEFEEGREIGGMFLLLLHVLHLLEFQRNAKNPFKESFTQASIRNAAVVVALSGAAFLWVNYQPSMNRRDNVAHCSGQFDFSRKIREIFSDVEKEEL